MSFVFGGSYVDQWWSDENRIVTMASGGANNNEKSVPLGNKKCIFPVHMPSQNSCVTECPILENRNAYNWQLKSRSTASMRLFAWALWLQTNRQSPWTGNDTPCSKLEGNVFFLKRTDICYQVHYLPRLAVGNEKTDRSAKQDILTATKRGKDFGAPR